MSIAALVVPVAFLKALMNGDPPPMFAWDGFAVRTALLFVGALVFWPRELPLPFEKRGGGETER